MPDKFTEPEEVIGSFARMDSNSFTAKIGKIAQNGDFYFGSILTGANGSTNIRGEINLSAKARDNIVSAMNKVKNKQSDTITLEKSKYMCTL